MKREFSRQIFTKAYISSFIKIRLVGAQLFHADGHADKRTDRNDKAKSHFSQFFERA
jgi:hypothetical protein